MWYSCQSGNELITFGPSHVACIGTCPPTCASSCIFKQQQRQLMVTDGNVMNDESCMFKQSLDDVRLADNDDEQVIDTVRRSSYAY